MYKENDETFKKDKDCIKRLPCLQIIDLTLLFKMVILSRLIYSFDVILIKILIALFCISGQANLKRYMEFLGTLNSQNNTEKEKQKEIVTLSNFKITIKLQ